MIALMLAVAAVLLVALGVGASRHPRLSRPVESPRGRCDDAEELVILDIASDGMLDGDFALSDER